MSWRILIATLLLGIAASVWGGLKLGNWLLEHGPLKVEVIDAYQDLYSMPTLGADGKAYVPTPPQPLADGRLAVPETPERTDWKIDAVDLLAEHPPIALGTASKGRGGSIERTHTSSSGLQGLAQIGNRQEDVVQPIEMGSAPPPPSQEVQRSEQALNNDPSWQVRFQAELKACEDLGFTKAPSCKWDVRNKYCEPNNAWGKVPNCPKKSL